MFPGIPRHAGPLARKVAVRMRQQIPQRSLLQDLQIATQEPAGLVCIALIVALVTVAVRIAAIW